MATESIQKFTCFSRKAQDPCTKTRPSDALTQVIRGAPRSPAARKTQAVARFLSCRQTGDGELDDTFVIWGEGVVQSCDSAAPVEQVLVPRTTGLCHNDAVRSLSGSRAGAEKKALGSLPSVCLSCECTGTVHTPAKAVAAPRPGLLPAQPPSHTKTPVWFCLREHHIYWFGEHCHFSDIKFSNVSFCYVSTFIYIYLTGC